MAGPIRDWLALSLISFGSQHNMKTPLPGISLESWLAVSSFLKKVERGHREGKKISAMFFILFYPLLATLWFPMDYL